MEKNWWHHICFTWVSANGGWQLYKNGQLVDDGTGKSTNYVILSGGTAVIGQEQDSVGGGFEKQDAFGPGKVTELNLWNRVLSASDIAEQYANCTFTTGLVHSWDQFKYGINGNVQEEQPWSKHVDPARHLGYEQLFCFLLIVGWLRFLSSLLLSDAQKTYPTRRKRIGLQYSSTIRDYSKWHMHCSPVCNICNYFFRSGHGNESYSLIWPRLE